MKKTHLIIDAGHGGLHPTTGQYLTPANIGKKTWHTDGPNYHGSGWFYEGHYNRQSALDFMDQASAFFNCFFITDPYRDTPLEERVRRADEYYARLPKGTPCILLSFHSNSNSNTIEPQHKAYGYTLHTYALQGRAFEIARAIAPAMNQVFGTMGSLRPANWPLVFERKVSMTVHTDMPAIILEEGFFDNPRDARILMKPENISKKNATLVSELRRVLE